MLDSAKKITGHIMRVDGGKALTSRGQTDWYGMQYMNRKFEQEESAYYHYMLKKKQVKKIPQGRVGLEGWYEEVQGSKWATHSEEAHSKHSTMYSN